MTPVQLFSACKARACIGAALLMYLTACANGGPYNPLADDSFTSASLEQVQQDPNAYIGLAARWGGTIARVENLRDESLVEIVAQPLASNGRPRDTNTSAGRFVARIPEFIDPVLYARGRRITVTGTLSSVLQRDIGEHPYTFPVVNTTHHRLWEQQRERDVVFYPYFYGGSDHFGGGFRFPYWYW